MDFVFGRVYFNEFTQFEKTDKTLNPKEVAIAASSDVMGPFVILAQAGIQYFKDSCLRSSSLSNEVLSASESNDRNDSIVAGATS